jgi:hypothetical protein
MAREYLSRSAALSADQVVEALLDEVDVKSFVEKIPCAVDEALRALEERFYREYKSKKLINADHAADRVVELVAEVCNDFIIDSTGTESGSEFDILLQRAIRLSNSVRPLFT